MAKHKRQSKSAKKFKAAAVVATTVPLLVVNGASPAVAQPASAWDTVIECESGGQNIENAGPSTASGYFQIVDSTWIGAGGGEFAPRAIDATFEQQAIVAQRIAERRGSLADWNASSSCWNGAIDSSVPDGPATSTAPAPVEEPAAAPVEEPAPAEDPPVVEQAAAAPVAPVGNTYTVVAGDSLVRIGESLGIDWREIATLNGIAEPYIIDVNQILNLPVTQEQYTVVSGDTLSEIAIEKLGMSEWQSLFELNRPVIGDDPDKIYPNQVFFVGGLPLAQAPVSVPESTEVPAETQEAPASAQFFNPLPGSSFNSEFGPRDRDGDGYAEEFHAGIDLGAPLGAKIYAAAAGQVITNGWNDHGCGFMVQIRDIDGFIHSYCHMAGSQIQEGQWVEAGQWISNVDVQGDTNGPHLHYMVETSPGMPINPETWLNDRGVFVR